VARLVARPPGRRVGFHLVTHPDGVQRVLAGGAGGYVKDSRFYQEMAATLGDGLLTIGSQFALTEAWWPPRSRSPPTSFDPKPRPSR
jgi:hypothetical protein